MKKQSEEKEQEHIKIKAEDITIQEFIDMMNALNLKGKEATIKHRELYPPPKVDEDGKEVSTQIKGGRRYHAPGSNSECLHCKPIIESFNEMMMLQTDIFGLTGIQMEPLIAAMKITRATVLMMKKGGELN